MLLFVRLSIDIYTRHRATAADQIDSLSSCRRFDRTRQSAALICLIPDKLSADLARIYYNNNANSDFMPDIGAVTQRHVSAM